MKYPLKFANSLTRNTYKGKYIAIEGIDGSGKTTQIKKIKAHLEKMGHEVVLTSEPMSEGSIQEIIRSVLASKVKMPTRAYQAIYSADRAINHATIVEPALKAGKIVLSHRSNWSSIPHGILDLGEDYSFYHHAWPIAVASGLLSGYHQFIVPDLTFYLKITARDAMERLTPMRKKKDLYEKGEKLAKIVYGYDTEMAKFPDEFIIIDGEQSVDLVTEEILEEISGILNLES